MCICTCICNLFRWKLKRRFTLQWKHYFFTDYVEQLSENLLFRREAHRSITDARRALVLEGRMRPPLSHSGHRIDINSWSSSIQCSNITLNWITSFHSSTHHSNWALKPTIPLRGKGGSYLGYNAWWQYFPLYESQLLSSPFFWWFGCCEKS